MASESELQELNISPDWEILQHNFYDIDHRDNNSLDHKLEKIFYQEDMVLLRKGKYHLDLGWYGSNNLIDETTGYCIHLFRGNNWNDSELLEKFRSRDKQEVTAKINQLIKAVDNNYFINLNGYRVDENDPKNQNDFSDLEAFSLL